MLLDKPNLDGSSLEGIEHIYETEPPTMSSWGCLLFPYVHMSWMPQRTLITVTIFRVEHSNTPEISKASRYCPQCVAAGISDTTTYRVTALSVYHKRMRTSGEYCSFGFTSLYGGILSVLICSLSFTWDIHMVLLMVWCMACIRKRIWAFGLF